MNNQSYAIAEIAGDQVILEPGKNVSIPKVDLEVGAQFIADKILFLHSGADIKVGRPYLSDVTIETIVLEHRRADKVMVFKKKRRKGYQVKKGHRQPYTVLKVGEFGENTAKPAKVAPARKSRAKAKTAAQPAESATQENKE
ncbi:MAG: 50S ribosomal protein L21 [Candidatus Marinimicrobia bacterium]|jgi:large subunit ribosomal protein L21|nr:50S ribosomal protein L21 [Candidatus Neomarinimicrobiota bacterium]MDD5230122.1 50S ribosomal protein L21 [Candidatus Neomarinimicrobiota bacterium]MDD5539261.1 50S ribosomal protein L21 [Candidatus Neomarinimicrobiota bacterium]